MFEQIRERRERLVRGRFGLRVVLGAERLHGTCVLVLVTVDAEILPIAAIRRVVIVVVIAMMHGQLVQILTRELTAAACADPAMQLQRLLAVAAVTSFTLALGLGDDAVEACLIGLAVPR